MGYCDNCLKPKEQYEGEDLVKTALQAAEQTEERFGINHLVDVIRRVSESVRHQLRARSASGIRKRKGKKRAVLELSSAAGATLSSS